MLCRWRKAKYSSTKEIFWAQKVYATCDFFVSLGKQKNVDMLGCQKMHCQWLCQTGRQRGAENEHRERGNLKKRNLLSWELEMEFLIPLFISRFSNILPNLKSTTEQHFLYICSINLGFLNSNATQRQLIIGRRWAKYRDLSVASRSIIIFDTLTNHDILR